MRASTRRVLILVTIATSWAVAAQEAPSSPASNCTEWKAWHNMQPGTAPATLHITGTCHFPTAGYSVELVPVDKKGADSKVLVLRKVVHKPEGMAAQVLSDVSVHYTKETTTAYKTVLIRPEKVRVKVETVQ